MDALHFEEKYCMYKKLRNKIIFALLIKKGSDCCSETQTISFHNMPPDWQLKLKKLTNLNFTQLYKQFLNETT